MLKKSLSFGLLLVVASASGQVRPALGLQPYGGSALRSTSWALQPTTAPASLPGSRRQFVVQYALAQPLLVAPPPPATYTQPNTQVAHYPATPLATTVAVAGELASWLLGADPRVQSYQNYRQLAGQPVVPYRQARPDDLGR